MDVKTVRKVILELTYEEAEALRNGLLHGRGNLDVNSRAYEIVEKIDDGIEQIMSDWDE